jgi:hypothetical protein
MRRMAQTFMSDLEARMSPDSEPLSMVRARTCRTIDSCVTIITGCRSSQALTQSCHVVNDQAPEMEESCKNRRIGGIMSQL